MRRRLITFLTALSLLLLLAALTLWIRGFWLNDTFVFARTTFDRNRALSQIVYLDSDNCRFGITYRVQYNDLSPDQLATAKRFSSFGVNHGTNPTDHFTLLFAQRGDPFWNRLGFEYYTSNDIIEPPANTFDRTGAVPFWSVLLPCFLLPAFKLVAFARQRRARHRLRRNLCPTCNYDLRASKDRCPECGAPIPPRQTKSIQPQINAD